MIHQALSLHEALPISITTRNRPPLIRDQDPQLFSLTAAALTLASSGDRFAKNIAALRLLKELETSRRRATLAERLTLAHYSAFGESALLGRLFRWESAQARFVVLSDYAELITDAEAIALRRAALTAFYTPIDAIQAIWTGVLQLGLGALERVRIIEPAVGVGHFISVMPSELRERLRHDRAHSGRFSCEGFAALRALRRYGLYRRGVVGQ